MITLKTREQIERMRKAGRVTAGALDAVSRAVRVGVTTKELDAIAEDYIRSMAAFLPLKVTTASPAASALR